jgi:PAP2 superfamily C-terminal
MLTISILAMVSILVVRWNPPHGRPLYSVPILKRLLITLTACQILRCISFLCTTLPGASRQCLYTVPDNMTRDEMLYGAAPDKGNPAGWVPPLTVTDILWRVDATNGCGDLMFSSHTIFTMSFVCLIWRYFNWRSLRWAMLIMQVGGVWYLSDLSCGTFGPCESLIYSALFLFCLLGFRSSESAHHCAFHISCPQALFCGCFHRPVCDPSGFSIPLQKAPRPRCAFR